MKYYNFELTQYNNLVGEGFGYGENAVAAFEDAVQNRTVWIPSGAEVTVVATNDNGLSIIFEVYKG